MAETDGCWAKILGTCRGRLSAEHYMSAGLWDGPDVEVVGFKWCEEPKRVGLGSLTSKVLCVKHNNDLSPVDQAGQGALRAVKAMAQLIGERVRAPRRKWPRVRFEMDGPGLERWFLKTALNLCAMSDREDLRWEVSGSPLSETPEVLVRAAFGEQALVAPLGLYSPSSRGEDVGLMEGVTFAPVIREGGTVVGFAFTFGGLRFLLWVSTAPVPDRLDLPNAVEQAWRRSESRLRHLQYFRGRIGNVDSHYIHILWPEQRKAPSWILHR